MSRVDSQLTFKATQHTKAVRVGTKNVMTVESAMSRNDKESAQNGISFWEALYRCCKYEGKADSKVQTARPCQQNRGEQVAV